jgi:hypothetical protein
MTAKPRVSSSKLADRLLAAAEVADLAEAGLQAATWPEPNPHYEPVGSLCNARNLMLQAANEVDPVSLGVHRSAITKPVLAYGFVQTGGYVVGTMLAVLLSPASTIWYILPAVLVGWAAAYPLIPYLHRRLAWARLRAADRAPSSSVAALESLVEGFDDLLADIQPEISPGRRAAYDSAAAADHDLRWTVQNMPPVPATR